MWVKSVFSKYSWEKNAYHILHTMAKWLLASCSHSPGLLHLFLAVALHVLLLTASFYMCCGCGEDNLTIASMWSIPPGSIAKSLQWAGSTPCTMNGKCCALEQVRWSGSPWRICGPIRHPIWLWPTLYVTMGASPWLSTSHVGSSSETVQWRGFWEI